MRFTSLWPFTGPQAWRLVDTYDSHRIGFFVSCNHHMYNYDGGAFLGLFPGSVLQTFDDDRSRGDRSLVNVWDANQFSLVDGELKALNKRGAGVYFSVNGFNGRRVREGLVGYNAWFCEIDDVAKAEQAMLVANAALAPSLVVESKKGYHLYWLVAEGDREQSEAEYLGVLRALVSAFNGDAKCIDVCRVLRLPGFYHVKDRGEPWRIGVVESFSDSSRVYTLKEMQAAYGASVASEGVVEKKSEEEWLSLMSGSGEGGRNDAAARVIGAMVKRAPVKDKLVIWEMAKGWNQQNTPPLDERELRSVFESVWKMEGEARVAEKSELMEDLIDIEETSRAFFERLSRPLREFVWGNSVLDKVLPPIDRGHYCVLFGQQGSGKTVFAVHMARKNAAEGKKVLFVSLEMGAVQLYRGHVLARAGISKEQYLEMDFDPEALIDFGTELSAVNFLTIDRGNEFTVEKIKVVAQEVGADLVIVDNLNKIAIDIDGRDSEGALVRDAEVSKKLLNWSRSGEVCVVVVHHANKQKNEAKLYKDKRHMAAFRGMEGMRGNNKIADDADIIIEVARPSGKYLEEVDIGANEVWGEDRYARRRSGFAVKKDRDWGDHTMAFMYYDRGEYVDEEEMNHRYPKFIK